MTAIIKYPGQPAFRREIDNTLDALKAMGMGGGHIHCRTGMDNPYMGEEFLNLVKYSFPPSGVVRTAWT